MQSRPLLVAGCPILVDPPPKESQKPSKGSVGASRSTPSRGQTQPCHAGSPVSKGFSACSSSQQEKKKITTKILPGHGHETAEWQQAFSQPQAATGAAFTLSRSAEACARLLWFKRLQLHPWCFSGPHLIPRNRELKEFVEFLWLLACLQWSGALAEGSPNSPTPALVWLG